MSGCGICVKAIGTKLKLQCNDCKRDFHATCLKYSKADVECVTADQLVWRCTDCAATRRRSMRFDSEVAEGKLSLEDVMKVVSEIREAQKSSDKGYNDAFDSLESQLVENTNALKAQNVNNEKLNKLIETLMSENNQLKTKVKELEVRVEDLEQYSRSNCLEIQGIPVTPAEDVLGIVKEVGKAMNVQISDDMVDACHRLGRQTGDNPPGLIVKFVRRFDKEELLKQRRVKRNLSTRHIGRSDDRPIYINESLTPTRRRLYAMARRIQKEKDFKFLWVRNGKIFLRKEENSPVKVITCQDDLQ